MAAQNEKKKPICPNCGSETQCFRRSREGWLFFDFIDEYTLWCPKCNYRAASNLHAGWSFFIFCTTVKTTCPFCNKPADEHSPGCLPEETASAVKQTSEEVRLTDPDADPCPKCHKGEICCTFLGDMGAAGCFKWEHTCTNPNCDFSQTFPVWSDECDAEEKFGPGKAGGCPGPHK